MAELSSIYVGRPALGSFPVWAQVGIVAGSAVLGPVVAFVLVLVIALLLRWVTRVREPPALVIVAARDIGGYLRRRLFRGVPYSAPELVHSEPAVADPPGLSLPI